MKHETDVTVILDRSGSMEAIASDVIGGFNRFLMDQQHEPGDCRLTLVEFDNEYEVVYASKPIREAAPLTGDTFQPRGTTALLDAIGRTIDANRGPFSGAGRIRADLALHLPSFDETDGRLGAMWCKQLTVKKTDQVSQWLWLSCCELRGVGPIASTWSDGSMRLMRCWCRCLARTRARRWASRFDTPRGPASEWRKI